jgi:hypothetical protein
MLSLRDAFKFFVPLTLIQNKKTVFYFLVVMLTMSFSQHEAKGDPSILLRAY